MNISACIVHLKCLSFNKQTFIFIIVYTGCTNLQKWLDCWQTIMISLFFTSTQWLYNLSNIWSGFWHSITHLAEGWCNSHAINIHVHTVRCQVWSLDQWMMVLIATGNKHYSKILYNFYNIAPLVVFLRKVLLPLRLRTNLEEPELLGLLNTLEIQKAFSVSKCAFYQPSW